MAHREPLLGWDHVGEADEPSPQGATGRARSHRRSVLAGLSGATSALVVLAAGGPASASNFGSSPTHPGPPVNEVSLGDDSFHMWSMHRGDQSWRQALQDTISVSYEPTNLVTSQRPDFQRDADVRVDVANHGTRFYGWVYCPDDGTRRGTDPLESCFRQWLKIDLHNAARLTQDQRKSLMCHEFGHTLGLRHPTPHTHHWRNSCMTDDPNNWPVALHRHDVDHLNRWYPAPR